MKWTKDKKPPKGWLRVRTWDDMEKEFGVNLYGSIDVPNGFTTPMELAVSKQKGRRINITEWRWMYDSYWMGSSDTLSGWNFSPEMFENPELLNLDFSKGV